MDAFFNQLYQWLVWDRSAIQGGELWRLVTAQFVHLSPGHAGANLFGLALWFRLERLANHPLSAWQRVGAFFLGSCVVHLGLLGLTRYDWYAGASAALYGLFAFTAMRCGWRGGVLLGGLLVWTTAGSQLVTYAFPVAHHAHWVGVATGVCAGVGFWVWRRSWPSWGLPA